jgi:hypothetical protein
MTSQTFTATAGQLDFPFTFPYLSEAHLTVSVDGASTPDWSLTTSQTLRLGATFQGGGALTGGEEVAIRRSTPIAAPLVTFASPSTLRSSEINLAILQVLYNLQEQDEETLTALRADTGDTKWLAQSKPIKEVGAPVDSDDAARLSDIQSAIVAGGNIPAFSGADIGRDLGIDRNGNAGWQSPGGGVSTFRVVPQSPDPVAGAVGGFQLASAAGSGFGSAADVEKVADLRAWWSGTAPSVSGTTDILLPSTGVYEVTAQVRLRSIPQGVTIGQSVASVSLTDSLGATSYDSSSQIRLGFDGPGAGIQDAWQGSASVTLSAIIAVTGSASINLRGFRSNASEVVMDVPSTITVKELR